MEKRRQPTLATAADHSQFHTIANRPIHGLGLGRIDEGTLPVLFGNIADAFFDLRLDFGILVHPIHNLLIASLGELVALHFPEHQFPNEFFLAECFVVLHPGSVRLRHQRDEFSDENMREWLE